MPGSASLLDITPIPKSVGEKLPNYPLEGHVHVL
jgi:hypothetical protein